MIRPRGFPGVAFGEAVDRDPRTDHVARAEMSTALGIPSSWAIVDQVHGSHIVTAGAPGHFGEADGIHTTTPMMPVAVATADCLPVVLIADESVCIVHAGWRGVAAGIVEDAKRLVEAQGETVSAAVVGPHIGPCCFEVGPEVIAALGGYEGTTEIGTRSADLGSAVEDQLPGITVAMGFGCTAHDDRFHSFRENATQLRQVTVAWVQQD